MGGGKRCSNPIQVGPSGLLTAGDVLVHEEGSKMDFLERREPRASLPYLLSSTGKFLSIDLVDLGVVKN